MMSECSKIILHARNTYKSEKIKKCHNVLHLSPSIVINKCTESSYKLIILVDNIISE